jgi:hypothetical protein
MTSGVDAKNREKQKSFAFFSFMALYFSSLVPASRLGLPVRLKKEGPPGSAGFLNLAITESRPDFLSLCFLSQRQTAAECSQLHQCAAACEKHSPSQI